MKLWRRRSSCDRRSLADRVSRVESSSKEEMEPSEVVELLPGAPVWLWIVCLGKGKWWPGVVQSLKVIDGFPHVMVRFEGRAPEGRNSHPAAFVGISTTRMRFLEHRDLKAKGGDRPRHVPVALLRVPETPIQKLIAAELENPVSNGEAQSAK